MVQNPNHKDRFEQTPSGAPSDAQMELPVRFTLSDSDAKALYGDPSE
ncbi:MAG: hypothetical protein ACE5HE_03090 [Phycisphaerae bacterium]